MSASGLPGKRVEASRAGMTTIGRKDGGKVITEGPRKAPIPAAAPREIAALCRTKTGSARARVALLSRRFNHIPIELSAKIGFSPAALTAGPAQYRG
jgi:hypothetical protein